MEMGKVVYTNGHFA